jgi:hypothetical protein
MAPQAVARPLDVDDDSMVKKPVQQRGGDHGVPEHRTLPLLLMG